MSPCIQYYAAAGIMFAGCPFVCASVRTRSGGGIPGQVAAYFYVKKILFVPEFYIVC